MKTSVIFILLLFAARLLSAQYLTDSNLPIVVINTDINPNTGQPLPIPDEPKVPASMKIIKRPGGARNFISDQSNAAYLNYSGRIGIEMRGSSSQTLPKKPNGFKILDTTDYLFRLLYRNFKLVPLYTAGFPVLKFFDG